MRNYQTSGSQSSSAMHDEDQRTNSAGAGAVRPLGARRVGERAEPLGEASSPGFIVSSISLTRPTGRISTKKDREHLACFENLGQYQLYKLRKWAKSNPKQFIKENPHYQALLRGHVQRSIFRVSSYPSGEVSGYQVVTGRQGKHSPPPRPENLFTMKMSSRGKNMIRRSIENALTPLSYFVTLTFDPKLSKLNTDGTINQSYAKSELKRFFNTLSKMAIRRFKVPLSYVWVAENQLNGNIHFHAIWNHRFDIKYITKIWNQANNSVDIAYLQNVHHAKRYLIKYITKDISSAINGNRYAISKDLRLAAVPVTYVIENKKDISMARASVTSLKCDISSLGGYVNDFGFCVPMPERPRKYKGKDGSIQQYRGVPRWLKGAILDIVLGEVPF